MNSPFRGAHRSRDDPSSNAGSGVVPLCTAWRPALVVKAAKNAVVQKKPSGRTSEPGRPDRRWAQRRGEPRCRARRVAAAAAAGESPGEVREGEKEAERESERGRSRRRGDKTRRRHCCLRGRSLASLAWCGGRVVVQVDGLVISPKLRRRVLFFSVSFHLSRMQQLSPPGKLYLG